jgi:hypothetical protein
MKNIYLLTVSFVATMTLMGCEQFNEDGGKNNQGSPNDFGPGGPREELRPEDLGKNIIDVNRIHVDLNGAQALLTLEQSDSVVDSSIASHSVRKLSASSSGSNPLWKMDAAGDVQKAVRVFGEDSEDAFSESEDQGLESDDKLKNIQISYMAVSAYGEVYIVLAHPIIYTDSAIIKNQVVKIEDYENPWQDPSPFKCQFFLVNQLLADYGAADQIQKSNLRCITQLGIDTWDPRSGLIQFDDAGNVYFTAHVQGNWKNVLLKLDRQSLVDSDKIVLTEVVNANITFRDVLVTSLGGVLYTGETSTDGTRGGGGSFFRYVTPDGKLKEIANDWWDFTFKAVLKGANKGKIIFYGPSTLTSGKSGWDTACLRLFDPTKENNETTNVDERSEDLAICRNDIWRYVNDQTVTAAVRKNRCEEDSYYLGSGKPLSGIFTANVKSDAEDEIIIVSDVRHKLAGEWYCNLCVEPNQTHCVDADGELLSLEACTDDELTALSTTHLDANNDHCYQNITTDAICETELTSVRINHTECNLPGDTWTSELGAISLVNTDKSITVLSEPSESIVNAWVIDDIIYFSSYATGIYRLKKVTFDTNGAHTVTSLLNNYEIYKLVKDPAGRGLLINALSFTNNAYVMGTFDPTASSPEATLSTRTEITGVIKTILIFQ